MRFKRGRAFNRGRALPHPGLAAAACMHPGEHGTALQQLLPLRILHNAVDMQLARYRVGEHFAAHHDSAATKRRWISMLIYLGIYLYVCLSVCLAGYLAGCLAICLLRTGSFEDSR